MCFVFPYYHAVLVLWNGKTSQFDVMLCKVITAANSHHPRAAIEWLYLPCCMGG